MSIERKLARLQSQLRAAELKLAHLRERTKTSEEYQAISAEVQPYVKGRKNLPELTRILGEHGLTLKEYYRGIFRNTFRVIPLEARISRLEREIDELTFR